MPRHDEPYDRPTALTPEAQKLYEENDKRMAESSEKMWSNLERALFKPVKEEQENDL